MGSECFSKARITSIASTLWGLRSFALVSDRKVEVANTKFSRLSSTNQTVTERT